MFERRKSRSPIAEICSFDVKVLIYKKLHVLHSIDNSFYLVGMENVPRRVAIVRANRYMGDHADYLIVYAWLPASNARNLAEYAEKKIVSSLNWQNHSKMCILMIDLRLFEDV